MNRQHKFRVWDELTKTMITDDTDFNSDEWNAICKKHNYDSPFEEDELYPYSYITSIFNLPVGIDGLDVMEYTGLKDCKEKDVYEGDIVEEHMFYVDENKNIVEKGKKVWEVVWKDFGWRVDDHNDNCNNVAIMDNADEYWSKHCTVIGNIYQNADLLIF